MIFGVLTGLIGVILSLIIWKNNEDTYDDHMNVTVPSMVPSTVDEPVYVTVVCGKSAHRYCPFRFRSLQNLIGSLHRYRDKDGKTGLPFVHVFGHRLSTAQLHLLHQWRRVYYHDIDLAFPDLEFTNSNGTTISNGKRKYIFTNGALVNVLMRRMLGDYTNVVYVDANFMFDGYVGNIFLELMNKYGHIKAFDTSRHLVAEAARNPEDLKIDPYVVKHSELYAKSPSRDPNSRCYTLQRLEIARSHYLNSSRILSWDDRTIVLGAPMTSRRTERPEDHPLSNILVPSLVETAKANPNWKFVLLLAFDVGDKFLDDPLASSVIRDTVMSSMVGVDNLEILFIRVVQTKSVAMLWNLMYDMAMTNAAKYFYMINDDVTFMDHNWPTNFTRAIDAQGGNGIAGPKDMLRGCSLMTQVFIGRGHCSHFGYLFPPDFHNWWCDNWINRLYERVGQKTCFEDIRIRNGGRKDGAQPRYQACRNIDFSRILETHITKLRN